MGEKLDQLRQTYPEWADLPDFEFVDKLWENQPLKEDGTKAYWDMGKAKFELALGLKKPSYREAETKSLTKLEESPPSYGGVSKLERDTRGWISRPTAVATGAIPGAIGGGTLGSTVPGVGTFAGSVLGGAGGAAVGSLGFDAAEALYRKATGDSPRPEARTILDDDPGVTGPLRRASGEAALDMTFGYLPGLKHGAKRTAGRLLGTYNNPAAIRMADLAEEQGVQMGPGNLSERAWPKVAAKMFSVFPFTHGVYSRRQKQILGNLDERAQQLMSELAPTATLYSTSKDAVATSKNRYSQYDNVVSALYGQFWHHVEKAGDPVILSSQPIKQAIGEINKKIRRESLYKESGELIDDPTAVAEVQKFIDDLADLPSHISFGSARGLERRLNKMGQKYDSFELSELGAIKEGLERAKNSIDPELLKQYPKDQVDKILHSWKTANEFFGTTRDLWGGATARNFGTVERNMFNESFFKPGSKQADQIFSSIWNSKSLDAIDDLQKIVGQRQYKEGIQQYIRKAFEGAIKLEKEGGVTDQAFSAQTFKDTLGLDTREGQAFFKKALGDELAGEWNKFLEVASKATDIEIGDPSIFAMRRIILSGPTVRALVGTAVAGGGAAGGPPGLATMLAISSALWGSARFLNNPKHLRDVTRLIDPQTPHLQWKTTLARLGKAAAEQGEDSGSRQRFEDQLREEFGLQLGRQPVMIPGQS